MRKENLNTSISDDQAAHDELWIRHTLMLADRAAKIDEVPVGALIVKDDLLIASGYNQREKHHSVVHHAEIIAIRKASSILKNWRLIDCTLYCSLEPCLMCAGAIYQSRIARVVYAAKDPKAGAMGSLYEIHNDKRLNHFVAVTNGILQKESEALLKNFFKKKRQKT